MTKKADDDLTSSNTIVLLRDSMVKNVQGWNVGKGINHRFVVKDFSGAKVADMYHHVKPTLEQAPGDIATHCGTNDLHDNEPKANLAEVISTETTKVSILNSLLELILS